jgi:hypothetical protein
MNRVCHLVIILLVACAVAVLVSACGGSVTTVTVEATNSAETTRSEERGPTEAVLKPVGDQTTARGTARYSLNPSRIPALQVNLKGLEPVSGLARYAIWIYGDRHNMAIMGAYQTDKKGNITARFETVQSYSFVEEGTKNAVLVTKTNNIYGLRKGIAESADPWNPNIIGEPVLQGKFEGPFLGSSEPR